MILGESAKPQEDDKDYCLDLGLIRKTDRGVVVSNQIYQEVIPRELTKEHQDNFAAKFNPDWINSDGSLNTHSLLKLFRDFWLVNSGIWGSHIAGYQEAAPQLVTQAFLQRVANGNGSIQREYGIERKRTDLMLKWKYQCEEQLCYQKVVLELKTIKQGQKYETLLEKGLE
jgi:hypothetical protein